MLLNDPLVVDMVVKFALVNWAATLVLLGGSYLVAKGMLRGLEVFEAKLSARRKTRS